MEPTVNPPSQPLTEFSQETKKRNNTLTFVIILLVLAAIGGMLYFIFNKNEVKTQAIQQETSAPTTTNTSTEEQEVEVIDLGDPEPSELKEAEKDVQGL